MSIPFARTGAGLLMTTMACAALWSAREGLQAQAKAPAPDVRLTVKESERRVDVTVDGKPFTSYVWPTTLKKPTFYPVRTADGVVVTRGFPPGAGERADHPHHVGLWMNYGDVNGFDFWNNSDAIKPENAPKMGAIVQKEITRKESGKGRAELGVKADWVSGVGQTILEENTTFTFEARPGVRIIDRVTMLRPTAGKVTFTDNKEGMLGLRVIRALEDPNEKSGEFTDAAGRVTKMQNMDTTGVTGVYTSSEGKKGGAVWGTRGKWTMLSGTVAGKPVTVAILDHPGNPGFPTYWHARGYGLFAANPLGQAVFSEGKEKLNFAIGAGESQLFRYRILLLDAAPTAEEMERQYAEWSGAAKGSR
jgi:Methane oxygenase PmoA